MLQKQQPKRNVNSLKKLQKQTTSSFRDKGSKFIGYLFPATSIDDFDKNLDQIRRDYPDATHHCYAWRLHPEQVKEFSQDDGEPNGTAGLPILNQLKSFEIINAGLVVIRYYGGTNLGKSGLIKAYGRAAELCLQEADLQRIQLIWKLKIDYPYNQQNVIESIMYRFNLSELASSYTEVVSLTLGCPVDNKQKLERKLDQMEHLDIQAEFIKKSYL